MTDMSCLISKHGVRGLQLFVFCLVTFNDEHRKARFKIILIG